MTGGDFKWETFEKRELEVTVNFEDLGSSLMVLFFLFWKVYLDYSAPVVVDYIPISCWFLLLLMSWISIVNFFVYSVVGDCSDFLFKTILLDVLN